MLFDVLAIGAGAVVVGFILGAIGGSVATGRRMRRQIEEIGSEVATLTRVAEDKLLDDDPNLPDLMRNLNTAVEQAYKAIDALENQSELNRRKTEGAKEIAAATRRVINMMEDMGADLPHVSAPKIQSVADETEEASKPPPMLR